MSIFINGVDRTPVNSLVLLNAAAGNEVANRMDYTVNKAAGNDTGYVINKTDILSTGTSYIIDIQRNGTSVLTLEHKGKIIQTSTLEAATGNEVAYTLNYTVNKLTSGNDGGLQITMTDTQSPGTSLGLHCLHGANSIFAVDFGNERVGILTSTPNSKLHVAGSLSLPIVTKAFADTGYTVTATDYTILCNAVGGAITINLPTAVGISGRIYNFKKIDSTANLVTIDANGAETIDTSGTLIISTQDTSFTIQSDNANYRII